MKFILIGEHTPEWSARFATRSARAFAKVNELGITVESSYYTQAVFVNNDVRFLHAARLSL